MALRRDRQYDHALSVECASLGAVSIRRMHLLEIALRKCHAQSTMEPDEISQLKTTLKATQAEHKQIMEHAAHQEKTLQAMSQHIDHLNRKLANFQLETKSVLLLEELTPMNFDENKSSSYWQQACRKLSVHIDMLRKENDIKSEQISALLARQSKDSTQS